MVSKYTESVLQRLKAEEAFSHSLTERIIVSDGDSLKASKTVSCVSSGAHKTFFKAFTFVSLLAPL